MKSVVCAFDMKRKGMLTTGEERRLYLEGKADCLVSCPFTKEFRELSAEAFIRDVIKGVFRADYVVIGTDFCFGHEPLTMLYDSSHSKIIPQHLARIRYIPALQRLFNVTIRGRRIDAMQYIKGLESYAADEPCAVTFGKFDGLHRGPDLSHDSLSVAARSSPNISSIGRTLLSSLSSFSNLSGKEGICDREDVLYGEEGLTLCSI